MVDKEEYFAHGGVYSYFLLIVDCVLQLILLFINEKKYATHRVTLACSLMIEN